MITVKFSADNVRLFQKARSEAELRGAVDLVLERIKQAETARTFGKPVKGPPLRVSWKKAREILEGALGEQLKAPPFPDPIWYQRVGRALRQYGIDETKLLEIASYVKDHLKPPYSMDFIICQHERILSGEFDSTSPRRGSSTGAAYIIPNWRKNVLPED